MKKNREPSGTVIFHIFVLLSRECSLSITFMFSGIMMTNWPLKWRFNSLSISVSCSASASPSPSHYLCLQNAPLIPNQSNARCVCCSLLSRFFDWLLNIFLWSRISTAWTGHCSSMCSTLIFFCWYFSFRKITRIKTNEVSTLNIRYLQTKSYINVLTCTYYVVSYTIIPESNGSNQNIWNIY